MRCSLLWSERIILFRMIVDDALVHIGRTERI